MEHKPEFVDKTRSWFESTLNEHGYGFQQSVLKAAQELFAKGTSGWLFQVSEFPVEIRGKGTRIDFILQREQIKSPGLSYRESNTILMIAECKRANPAYANWCFAKSPYRSRGDSTQTELLILEEVNRCSEVILHGGGGYNIPGVGLCRAISSHKEIFRTLENFFHIAVEVKTDLKGNSTSGGKGNDAVEAAASQVCQGLSGMVHFLALNDPLWEKNAPVTLLPVIFTTANLWTSDADLSAADLDSGNLDFTDHGFKAVPWLFYQYNLSPGIKHMLPSVSRKEVSLSAILKADYVRTIPIVNSSGIADFLKFVSSSDFDH